jgi:hypothetical protein
VQGQEGGGADNPPVSGRDTFDTGAVFAGAVAAGRGEGGWVGEVLTAPPCSADIQARCAECTCSQSQHAAAVTQSVCSARKGLGWGGGVVSIALTGDGNDLVHVG